MKIRTYYTCDICGREFLTEGSCKEHEKAHAGGRKKIVKAEPDEDCIYSYGTPDCIMVTFDDGEIGYYAKE